MRILSEGQTVEELKAKFLAPMLPNEMLFGNPPVVLLFLVITGLDNGHTDMYAL